VKQSTDDLGAIHASYQSQVEDLFRILVEALVDGDKEENALERFEEGMATLKRAWSLTTGERTK
jgi:hypothetical protein